MAQNYCRSFSWARRFEKCISDQQKSIERPFTIFISNKARQKKKQWSIVEPQGTSSTTHGPEAWRRNQEETRRATKTRSKHGWNTNRSGTITLVLPNTNLAGRERENQERTTFFVTSIGRDRWDIRISLAIRFRAQNRLEKRTQHFAGPRLSAKTTHPRYKLTQQEFLRHVRPQLSPKWKKATVKLIIVKGGS